MKCRNCNSEIDPNNKYLNIGFCSLTCVHVNLMVAAETWLDVWPDEKDMRLSKTGCTCEVCNLIRATVWLKESEKL